MHPIGFCYDACQVRAWKVARKAKVQAKGAKVALKELR